MNDDFHLPKEVQYAPYFMEDGEDRNELMGVMSTARWQSDPKLLGISLSRYKFVSKMFANFESVLEVGAGDCWYSRVVLDTVTQLTLSDFDPIFEKEFKSRRFGVDKKCSFVVHDFSENIIGQTYDGIYLLDVLEHIDPEKQVDFLSNVTQAVKQTGAAIFGLPSLESQKYASEGSKKGHVNCQTGSELYNNLKLYFDNVFIFSMSDEVVHTGFMPLAHYLLALCTGPKKA